DDGARLSGFLLWDSSYAEFKFRNELWPDYNEKMLLDDLKEYLTRNRRKGK
ncbi:MAG: undecaprenyl diphosphate synthase family protein, partial [Candidatus Hodarchaeales archaeon]